MQVQDLLKQTDKLPNVPDVVRELIVMLSDPNANYFDISKKVAHDQTLSLKVLRVVNSAYFGLSRKVYSIDEATVILGINKLKTMVIASGFANSVKSVEGIELTSFWRDSFRVAILAQWLARRTELVDPEEAFTVGIVHNIGRLLLHLTAPTIALEIQTRTKENFISRTKAELDSLTFTTQDASKALMDLWKFPPVLGEAVRMHKHPFSEQDPQPLACVLNLACYLNACIRTERDEELVIDGFPKTVAKGAGLPEQIIYQLDEALLVGDDLDVLLS